MRISQVHHVEIGGSGYKLSHSSAAFNNIMSFVNISISTDSHFLSSHKWMSDLYVNIETSYSAPSSVQETKTRTRERASFCENFSGRDWWQAAKQLCQSQHGSVLYLLTQAVPFHQCIPPNYNTRLTKLARSFVIIPISTEWNFPYSHKLKSDLYANIEKL